MRPVATGISTQGTMGGRKIGLSIDLNSMQFIMQQLTDLYSDPSLAVIREYSTNALDSHVEAGNKNPIEVSTPSRMSPHFKVRDFGVGLDEDGIAEVYSKYGASTKRNTDNQVGMLGFGCKSGLTYTSQIVINSWKNGFKYSATLSKDKEGTASIQIADIRPSDEPTGVEIVIPVKDHYEFNSKIAEFYKFWQPGTVLVDGVAPEGFKGMEKLEEGLYMDPQARGDYVVMGSVPYRTKIPVKMDRGYRYNYSVVAIAPVGSVDFPPSREELQMTNRTVAWLADAGSRFDAALHKKINDDVAKAPTASEAMDKAWGWRERIGASNVNAQYKGKDIPFTFYMQDQAPKSIGLTYSRSDTSGRMFNLNEYTSGGEYVDSRIDFQYPWLQNFNPNPPVSYKFVASTSNAKLVIITGWEMKKFTSLHVRKVRMYLEKLGMVKPPVGPNDRIPYPSSNVTVCISRNSKIMDDGWLDAYATHIKWEDITTMKLPRQAKKNEPSYFVHTKDSADLAFIDDTKPIAYRTNGWNGHNSRSVNHKTWLFETLDPGTQVVVLSDRRLDKFLRTYPNAVKVTDALRAKVNSFVANLPKPVLDKFATDGVVFSSAVSGLDHKKINDPDLASALRTSVTVPTGWTEFNNSYSCFRDYGIDVPLSRASRNRQCAYEARYPLLKSLSWSVNSADVIQYINMVYNLNFNPNRKAI